VFAIEALSDLCRRSWTLPIDLRPKRRSAPIEKDEPLLLDQVRFPAHAAL